MDVVGTDQAERLPKDFPEFEQRENAMEDDRAMGGAENETPRFPPLPQLLEIPRGFPHLPQRDGET